MSKPRIAEWTELRGLAYLAVVLQHCIGEYIYRSDIQQPDSVMLAMLYHLTRFGTPTFVFLSAALLFYNGNKPIGYPRYIGRRFRDIYVPFLCWTVIYWVCTQNWSTAQWGNIYFYKGMFEEMIIPVSGYHLWFVVMIFQFYILFPLFAKAAGQVQAFLRRYSTKRRKQLVVAIMLIAATAYALLLQWSYYDMSAWSTGLPSFWQTLLDYRTYNFVMYFFYFMLGAVCAYMTDTWRGLAKQTLPWNVFVFIGLFMLMGHTMLIQSGDTINLNISTYLKPSTFVLIVSQLLLLYGLLLHLQKDTRSEPFRRMLNWIGRYSFGGYLAHALVLAFISYYTRSLALGDHHFTATLITFIVVASVSLGISWLFAHLPGGNWIVGSKGRQRLNWHSFRFQFLSSKRASKSTQELG